MQQTKVKNPAQTSGISIKLYQIPFEYRFQLINVIKRDIDEPIRPPFWFGSESVLNAELTTPETHRRNMSVGRIDKTMQRPKMRMKPRQNTYFPNS